MINNIKQVSDDSISLNLIFGRRYMFILFDWKLTIGILCILYDTTTINWNLLLTTWTSWNLLLRLIDNILNILLLLLRLLVLKKYVFIFIQQLLHNIF